MSEVKVDTISERTAANGVAVDGVTIKDSGLTIPSGGTLTVASGATISGLDIVNADVNASAAIAQSKLATLAITDSEVADNALSGNKIDGGTISDFASTGIDDNATSTAITIDSSEYVGIGEANPDAELHVTGTGKGLIRFENSTGVSGVGGWIGQNSASDIMIGDGTFSTANVFIAIDESADNVGILTTAPGQVLDVNAGSGNMIADGYDTHSLAVYKENINDASGYLDKVLACPAQTWNRKPFISAEEIKAAALEEFGESVWKESFPEDDSHRQKALYDMPEGALKTWIDEWCEAKRVEMRPEDKWQKKRLGLVADAELTAEHLPEVISINDDGEPTGIDTMTYIGILHNAIQELSAKVSELETN